STIRTGVSMASRKPETTDSVSTAGEQCNREQCDDGDDRPEAGPAGTAPAAFVPVAPVTGPIALVSAARVTRSTAFVRGGGRPGVAACSLRCGAGPVFGAGGRVARSPRSGVRSTPNGDLRDIDHAVLGVTLVDRFVALPLRRGSIELAVTVGIGVQHGS